MRLVNGDALTDLSRPSEWAISDDSKPVPEQLWRELTAKLEAIHPGILASWGICDTSSSKQANHIRLRIQYSQSCPRLVPIVVQNPRKGASPALIKEQPLPGLWFDVNGNPEARDSALSVTNSPSDSSPIYDVSCHTKTLAGHAAS